MNHYRPLIHPSGFVLIIVVVALTASVARADGPATRPAGVGPVPDGVRAALDLSPFYRQYVDAGGIAVVASEKPSPYALLEAAYLVERMLAARPDVREALVEAKMRVTVMAATEYTTDVPEHARLEPKEHWNIRGLGGTPRNPCTSGGEENLLNFRGDPYAGENILIHEFAHAVHEAGLRAADRTFDQRLRRAYDAAVAKGLWKGTYAATNRNEYWAEGVQSWFDCNQRPGGVHNDVNTREKLKAYDPELTKLLAEVFGDGEWRYVPPDRRKEPGHLAGLDRETLPRFAWPRELLEYRRKQEQSGKQR